MSAVWEHSQQEGNSLLLLLAIADACNDQGFCWPSIATIAHKIRRSPRSVQRLIAGITATGELQVDYSKGMTIKTPGGLQRTNLFTVLVKGGDNIDATLIQGGDNVDTTRPQGGDKSDQGGDRIGQGGDTAMSPKPSKEYKRESVKSIPEQQSSPKKPSYSDSFEEFWKSYPKAKRLSKRNAWKAWQKQGCEALLSEILVALGKHAKTKQWKEAKGKYIPLPSTWLNACRWEDEIDESITREPLGRCW